MAQKMGLQTVLCKRLVRSSMLAQTMMQYLESLYLVLMQKHDQALRKLLRIALNERV